MKKLLLFCSVLTALSLTAAQRVNPKELKIDLKHAYAAAEGTRVYTPELLRRLADFCANDPAGQALFRRMAADAAKQVNSWDYPPNRNYTEEIFRVTFQATGLIYFLTGNPEVGKFIHDKALELADKPLGYWLHEERYPNTARRGVGELQTGEILNRGVPGLDLANGCFTPEERAKLDAAIRDKAVIPCLKFLEEGYRKKSVQNHHAVVGNGVYLGAKFIRDPKAAERAIMHIKNYLEVCFEKDGSYGEGPQYLTYPLSVFKGAAGAMTPAERDAVFKSSALAKSAEYFPYPQVFVSGEKSIWKIMLRDGQQRVRGSSGDAWMLALVAGHPVAVGFAEAHGFELRPSSLDFALIRLSSQVPEARPLETLPLLRCFENGENYIRSGWGPDSTVFVMLSGDTIVPFGHDRAARNGIAFAAHGEYLLVGPGHTSYRSRVHTDWDATTRANNAITVDGRSQLFYRKVGKFGEEGPSHSEVVGQLSGKNCDVIISEAAQCYKPKFSTALRAVVYVRDPGYFVVFDRMVGEKPHRFDSYFHFNNFDGKAQFKAVGDNAWQLTRPRAAMRIFAFGDGEMQSRISPSIFHTRYAYSPKVGDASKPGTGIELQLYPKEEIPAWNVATVFFPEKAGAGAQFKCSGGPDVVTVELAGRTDRISLNGNRLTADIGGTVDDVTFPQK